MVAVTDGEACYPDDASWPVEQLRQERPREVERALAVLGIRAQVQRLGIPDGGIDRRRAELEQTLRDFVQPHDLVLAPWERDGHPDHDAVGRAALASVRQTGARLLRYPVWAWHWLQPDAIQPPFQAFRVPLERETLALKRRAIDCFTTQLDPGGSSPSAPILPAHVVERFQRPFEVYLS